MEPSTAHRITRRSDHLLWNNSHEVNSEWQGACIAQSMTGKQRLSLTRSGRGVIAIWSAAAIFTCISACAEQGQNSDGNQQPSGDCPSAPAVAVLSSGTTIFLHEASRPDATAQSQGTSDGGACSVQGVLPITGVTFPQARELCEKSGFDLCSLDDWFLGCSGDVNYRHPYGHTEQNGICNDFLSGYEELLPTMQMSACVSPDGLYDMVGNLWEWVISYDPDSGEMIKEYMGGSYKVTDMTRHMKPTFCGARITPIQHIEYYAADLGFRCCKTPD